MHVLINGKDVHVLVSEADVLTNGTGLCTTVTKTEPVCVLVSGTELPNGTAVLAPVRGKKVRPLVNGKEV